MKKHIRILASFLFAFTAIMASAQNTQWAIPETLARPADPMGRYRDFPPQLFDPVTGRLLVKTEGVTLAGDVTVPGLSTNGMVLPITDGLGPTALMTYSDIGGASPFAPVGILPYGFNGLTLDPLRSSIEGLWVLDTNAHGILLSISNLLQSMEVTGPLTDTQLRATPVPISGSISAELEWNNTNTAKVFPNAAASLTPSDVLTNALTALGFGVYQTSLPTKTDGQISPLQTDASGSLKVLMMNETLGYVYTDPVYSAITDGTNVAAVTASKALMVQQGALDYTTDSVTVHFANTNAYYTPSNPLVVKAVESTNSSAGFSKVVSVTPGTYNGAFEVNDAASYPFEIDCARANGKGVYLNNISGYTLNDASTAPPVFELYLFDTYPTVAVPGSAWDIADSSIAYCVGGPYSIPAGYWAAHSTLNGTFQTNTFSTLLFPASGSTKLYGVLKAKAVYTPVSTTNDLVLKFKFMQD